jgi:hypothetical protein
MAYPYRGTLIYTDARCTVWLMRAAWRDGGAQLSRHSPAERTNSRAIWCSSYAAALSSWVV